MKKRRDTASTETSSSKPMTMPFGKHIGKEIHEIPHDYLLWFRTNIQNLRGDLLRAVDAGLQGKPFTPPTPMERADEARQQMLERLRQRDIVH